MNKLQEAICKLEAKPDRDEYDEKLLQMMQEKARALGEDPSESEADAALKETIADHFRYVLHKKLAAKAEEETDGDTSWDADMEENIDAVRSVLGDMNLHYRDYVYQKGVHAFELGVRAEGNVLKMKVYLEASPRVCRIDAIYPFQPDPIFTYPLCEQIVKENYRRRFGALQYDARDGELSYRYSYPIIDGLNQKQFRTLFLTVAASAKESFEIMRQYSAGRFRKDVRQEVTCKAQRLIIELDL